MMSEIAGGRRGRVLGLKACIVAILALLLMIPLGMVGGLIAERSDRAEQVAAEIAGKWASSQSVQGPFLIVPSERVESSAVYDAVEQRRDAVEQRRIVLLPDSLSLRAVVDAETRSRGIFDSVVYTTAIEMKGAFSKEALAEAAPVRDGWRHGLDQAVLALSISDLRGLQGDAALAFDAVDLTAEPGTKEPTLPPGGIHWSLQPIDLSESSTFDLSLVLRGSERLSFLPVGKRSTLAMTGDWASPSFDGFALPVEHEVREDGFSAQWDISHLSLSLPRSWTVDAGKQRDWDGLAVGATLLQPVDFYLLSERSVKYGLLFVALLFLTFFLFEVVAGIALHPLQYLMVGAALVLFFLNLVSFAEVIGFASAYALSGGLVAVLVSLYAAAILKRRLWAALLCAMIAALYAVLYVILNLEEAAMLAGTLVLFAALAATMYATRKVDWLESLPTMPPRRSGQPAPESEAS